MLKRFNLEDMIPLITQTVESGKRFKLYPRGTSMLPMIVEDKTAVSLVAAKSICKNDVVLYRRTNGQYVLHRCVKTDVGEYIMCGDNQFALEKGITADMIIAKIDGYYPEDDFVSVEDKAYIKYVERLPLRRLNKRLKYYFKRIKTKLIKPQNP